MPEGVRSRHQARQRDGRTENQSWNAHSGPTRGRATFRNRVCSAHNIVVVALIGFLFVICLSLVAHFDGVLPAPRGLDTPLQEYSEARARAHLNTIVDFGVRTVGSKSNEVDTVKFLLDEVSKLQQEADEVQQKADDSSHDNPLKVLVDVHRPSGAFSSDFLEGFTNVYHNVTNVVVLIEGTAPAAEQRSVLVNAHFDTALGTPAASDDAVMIASMLEIARNVIHGPRLRHSVIFNFNGAEETNWMAAHGFITQHRWKHKIRAMINLEGAGAGGRELIIQTGPAHSWVAQTYAENAPWPHGHTVAQNVFQSGVIPGETDFQVYRDYGGKSIENIEFLPGIDLVAISKGHVYHTKLDDVEHIDVGTLQRTGENVLAVLRSMCNSRRLTDPGPTAGEEVVFFDVLGVVMIVYTQQSAFYFNAATLLALVVLLLFSPATRNKRRLCYSIVGAALSFFAGVGACLAAAVVLTMAGQPMKWYASPRVGYLLFSSLTVLGVLAVRTVLHSFVAEPFLLKQHAARSSRSPGGTDEDEEERARESSADEYPFFGTLAIWGCLLGFAMRADVESAYVCTLSIAFPLLFRTFAFVADSASGSSAKPHSRSPSLRRLALVIAGLLLPTLLLTQYALELAQFIFPLMGRIGTGVPPDVGVAIVFGSLVSLLLLTPLSLVHEISSPRLHRRLTAGVMLAVAVQLLVAVFLLQSYDAAHPKRMYYQHTRREWFLNDTLNHRHRTCLLQKNEGEDGCQVFPSQQDSGFFVNGIDFLNLKYFATPSVAAERASSSSIAAIANTDAAACNDETGMLCSMPFYFPIDKMVSGGIYIPAEDPGQAIEEQLQPDGPQAGLDVSITGAKVGDLAAKGDGLSRTFSFRVQGPDHLVLVVRANTLGSPLSAFEAGIDMSLLGGGRLSRAYDGKTRPREGKFSGVNSPSLTQSFWALDDWSFGKSEFMDGAHEQQFASPATPMYRNECNCYFVFRASGEHHDDPWEFDLTFVKNTQAENANDLDHDVEALIDVVVYGQFLEGSSEEMDRFIDEMPDWTTTVSWVSHWQQHRLDLLDTDGLDSR